MRYSELESPKEPISEAVIGQSTFKDVFEKLKQYPDDTFIDGILNFEVPRKINTEKLKAAIRKVSDHYKVNGFTEVSMKLYVYEITYRFKGQSLRCKMAISVIRDAIQKLNQ